MKFRGGRSTLSNGDMGDAHWRDNDLCWQHPYPSRLIKQSIPEKIVRIKCPCGNWALGVRDAMGPYPGSHAMRSHQPSVHHHNVIVMSWSIGGSSGRSN